MTITSDALGSPRRSNDGTGPAAGSQAARSSRAFDANAAKELKARDNVTNWFHLGQIYVVIAGTIGLAMYANSVLSAHGAHWGWTLAVNAIAITVIGAAQHQFGGAIHEGTHFLLFKNRTLNELASDWLAAFPIYTSTYQFRVHHLAHHQFVNDPERDPDIAQLKESGHWLDFPVPSIELVWKFLKQLSPLQLIKFTISAPNTPQSVSTTTPTSMPKAKARSFPCASASCSPFRLQSCWLNSRASATRPWLRHPRRSLRCDDGIPRIHQGKRLCRFALAARHLAPRHDDEPRYLLCAALTVP